MDQQFKSLSEAVASKLDLVEQLVQQKRFKEALAEIRDVENRKGLDNQFERGSFLYLSAVVLHGVGNYEEALKKGKEAFQIFKNTSENKKVAQIQFILGCIHIALGDFNNAEIELQDSVSTYRRIEDIPGVIASYNRLANICFVKSDFERAIKILKECIKHCDKVDDRHTRAKMLGNLGRIYMLTGKWSLAEENLLLSTKANEENKDEVNLSKSLRALGYVFYLERKFEEAKKLYQRSLGLVIKNNLVRELTVYHEYSGELAFAQGDFKLAREHYEKVIEMMSQIAPKGDMISQTYRLLADLLVAQKDCDQALVSCNKSLQVCLSLGERFEEAACYRILGQVYSAKKEPEKARENFHKSIKIFDEIKAKYELAKSFLETGKSGCFEFFDRMRFLGSASDIFKDLKSEHWVAKAWVAISQLFSESKEYTKAKLFLDDAEKLFNRLGEEKELKLILDLRERLKIPAEAGIEKSSGQFNEKLSPHKEYSFSHIITENHKMKEIINQASRIKDTDMTILLEGETGTGKDLLAKAIHYTSQRKDKRLVVVNCAIPESLLESELFGYKKGAFTGASNDKKGLLEEADGGTMFLNEVCDLPWIIQAKLLGVIENKELTRLGETKPRKVDFRIIAASNKDSEDEVRKGSFREDLYYRLNVIKFILPPLRERKEDIPILAKHFIRFYSQDDDKLSEDNLQSFSSYTWPGNIRELENEIKRMIALGTQENCFALDNSGKDTSDGVEKNQIIQALKKCNGVRSQAAKLLGVPRTTLLSKIERLDIKVDFH